MNDPLCRESDERARGQSWEKGLGLRNSLVISKLRERGAESSWHQGTDIARANPPYSEAAALAPLGACTWPLAFPGSRGKATEGQGSSQE